MKIKLMPFLASMLVFTAAASLELPQAKAQSANEDPLSSDSILRDPSIPVEGNSKGDITIVEYFDYRCPYCKKVNPVLRQVIQDDGHVRLVFKDWPVFGHVSIYAARLGLAAKYQNKYAQAHEALISAKEKLSEKNVQTTLAQAGIDVDRAQHDLAANQNDIDAILARNHEQATALGFEGTPAFIIGHFRVPGALDEANFKKAIADARAAAKVK
jgi:protein-disulfide isomerase